MRKLTLSLLLIFIIAHSALSFWMPVPPEIKKIVAFIFVPGKGGNLIPQGTGFFLGIKHPQKQDRFLVYLVTAKHVLQDNDKKFMAFCCVRSVKQKGSWFRYASS